MRNEKKDIDELQNYCKELYELLTDIIDFPLYNENIMLINKALKEQNATFTHKEFIENLNEFKKIIKCEIKENK